MSDNTQSVTVTRGGFFLPLLTLIFVVGKIWGPLASWSWWLVFLPMWGGFLVGLVILLIVLLGVVLAATRR